MYKWGKEWMNWPLHIEMEGEGSGEIEVLDVMGREGMEWREKGER